eukprot:jgi/Galph1/3771/GphlegSOOS_G2420.1
MIKKGRQGAAKTFISAAKARRKLQLSVASFQKLCILKGIYPRDPGKKVKSSAKTFYLTKDIQFLAHDPLIRKFWEVRAFRKKIRKAKDKKEYARVQSLVKRYPSYTLERIVRERYNTFKDALTDLDDALNLVFMVANLKNTRLINPDTVYTCRKLCREFLKYIQITGTLRKVFASVKGMYVQVQIEGVDILFIIPYRPLQTIPKDVDQRVLCSFLEFYICLIGCVNRHLYRQKQWKYPVQYDESMEECGFSIFEAAQVEPLNSDEAMIEDNSGTDGDYYQKPIDDESKESRELSNDTEAVASKLFKGFVFFLGRETPLEILDFIIRSCGGLSVWDGTLSRMDKSLTVTHYVCDRPVEPKDRKIDAEYIQPQWIFDCINANILLPVSLYLPGTTLPPHLSPFVNHKNAPYRPLYEEFIARYRNGETVLYPSFHGYERSAVHLEVGQAGKDEDGIDLTDKYSNVENDAEDMLEDKEEMSVQKKQQVLVPNDMSTTIQSTKEESKLARMMMKTKERRVYDRIVKAKTKETEAMNRLVRRQKEVMNS